MGRILLQFFLLLGTALIFTSCSESDEKDIAKTRTRLAKQGDPHSYANIEQIRTKHVHLELDVNFDNQTIYGVARHQMENLTGTDTAIFDIKFLEIQKVTIGKGNERETDYVIGPFDEILGSPLMVVVDSLTEFVNIYYKTTEETTALDWLKPNLTEGKKHPYLYSQSETIHTRTWIPLQCTPANRITYSADVKVPKELMALMSAQNPKVKSDDGIYHFEMDQKIPPYLIALAVGNIEYRELGKNCGVYAEPEIVDACAAEFEDMPEMIATAEKLFGPYEWGQYDVLVLPYTFPIGGMENPRLTFANPTLIAGDKSLVFVIAHELAHSWSGNLVTNASWNDFWLNEGFTVYLENRIMEALYGKEIAELLKVIEYQELLLTLDDLPKEQTTLKLDLEDPELAGTDIAYFKGAIFLRTLEKEFGRPVFDKFLNNYFRQFAFSTLRTEDFIDYLTGNLLAPKKSNFNIDEWIYAPGLPASFVPPTSERMEKLQKLAEDAGNGKMDKLKRVKREDMTTQEWMIFIRSLPAYTEPKYLQKLDYQFNFKSCGNAEIMTEWYRVGIRSGYTNIRPAMQQFITKVGRGKFIFPLYRDLATSKYPSDREWIAKVFAQAKDEYHPISRKGLEEILEKADL